MTAGVYILTLTTDGMSTVSPTAIGECGFDLEMTLFAEFGGGAVDGMQKTTEIESDCQVLWEFANMGNPWTFDIEKVG